MGDTEELGSVILDSPILGGGDTLGTYPTAWPSDPHYP